MAAKNRPMQEDFFADSAFLQEMEQARSPIKPSEEGTLFVALDNPSLKEVKGDRQVWTVPCVRLVNEDGAMVAAPQNAVWFLNDKQQTLLHQAITDNDLGSIAGIAFRLFGQPYKSKVFGEVHTLYDNVSLEVTDVGDIDLNRAIADYQASLQD